AKTSTPKATATSSASTALPTTSRPESDLGRRSIRNTIVLEQLDRGVAELVGVEGLGDEAIRAGLRRGFVGERPGADHDHRRVLEVNATAEFAEHVEPTAAGEHQVEHDQVRPRSPRELEAARAVGRFEEAITLLAQRKANESA